MMTHTSDANFLAISDIFKLAALDTQGVIANHSEWRGRYWSYFPRQTAEKVLQEYEAGTLTVRARDFAASITRVKDRIFESERTQKHGHGDNYNETHQATRKRS